MEWRHAAAVSGSWQSSRFQPQVIPPFPHSGGGPRVALLGCRVTVRRAALKDVGVNDVECVALSSHNLYSDIM